MPLIPTRIFLGWDRPALPSAATHLIDHYIDGAVADLRPATLVLPGRRARRRIIELLLDEAEARGATLIPPTATTVGNLPTELTTATKPVADDVTSRRAWSRALRSVSRDALRQVFPHLPKKGNLAEWDELAGLLSGLHRSVAGEGHRFSDVARICRSGVLFDDGPRWSLMARVQQRYLRLLDEAGLADRFAARTAALESGVAPFAGDLWLISIVELPAVTRRLVEASGADVYTLIHAPEGLRAFDDFGLPCTDYWETAHVPVTDDVLRVVESPVAQADAVIEALINLDGRYAAEDVVLAVHADSDVVPYLEQRLEARGVVPRYAAGTPLSHTAPLRLLEAVANYKEDRSFLALAALLRHPDAGPLTNTAANAPTRLEAIDAADRYFNGHLPYRLQGNLPAGERRAARFPPLVRALERTGPLSRLEGRKRLSAWMPLIRDVLLTAYGDRKLDRSKPAHRRLLDVLSRIRSAAMALAILPDPLDEECSGSAAIRALLLELRGEALAPEPRRDAVELLDWLELPLDDAPVVMLTGFNEGLLPESVSGHAFLPDALRTRLGLMDNRRRLARDAYRLTTVLHSKECVRLIAGRRTSQGDPLRPSRLMFRIPEEEMAARVLHFLKGDETGPAGSSLSSRSSRSSLASLGLEPGAHTHFTVPPEPVLELAEDEVPTRLRVTDFKSILDDPYRFVLERIYELDSVDDEARELDPLGFGSLAHEVLEGFGRMAVESPPAVDITDAAAVAGALVGLLDEEAAARFGSAALPAVALQIEQLRTRLDGFAARQAEWASAGWRIVGVEQQAKGDGVAFDVDGEPILLRGRIDRIDHNLETGHWAVLDYKTGNTVHPPDRTHRKGRGDDRKWIDLQLPLYRRLLSGLVDDEGLPVVGTEAVGAGGVRLGYISLPKDPDESRFMMAEWTEAELAEAEEVAREAVRTLRERTFHFDPTVTKSGRFGGDALEPLLAKGWQSTGDDEDGGWDDERGDEGGHAGSGR